MSLLSNCHPERFQDALDGSLSEDAINDLEQHLEVCEPCRSQLEQLAADENDWQKASDYFSIDGLLTDPCCCQPTVDIQLSRESTDSKYFVIEPDAAPGLDAAPSVLQPASHPEMLGRIDGFEIEQIIGRGGMGIVYKGYDTELNRPVAIKVLAEHLAANGVARQRFAREARAAAAVIHPNVVPIHSVNSTAKQPYLVMTLVSGRSLQAHIENNGPLEVKDTIRISRQIAAGLAAAHREGLVHRDIKPANILLEKDVSRVMITDFGLARAADDAAITQTGWLAGTPHYMSPEQASGKEVDYRSDLFSLGSVMYFMATGREPFRAEIPMAILQKIANETAFGVRSINSDATKTLQRVIERLMSKQPDHRFQSAEEVESVLTQYLAHLEQPESQPKPKIRRTGNRWWMGWLTGVLLVVALTTAYLWWSGIFTPQPTNTWPAGIQSPAVWQQEFEELEQDIRMLENMSSGSNSEAYMDPAETDAIELDRTIRQLENLLYR